jgi:lauroyl/myristoyl acyltransferase
MPMFCRRTRGGRFDVFGGPAMEMTVTGDPDEDVRTNTLRILAAVEDCIRGDPGQWFVLESIWDSRKTEDRHSLVRQSGSHGV